MEKLGLTREDLATFGIEQAEARARAVDERLRPRLERIAQRFAPPLSKLAGCPLEAIIELPDADSDGRCEAAVAFRAPGGGESGPRFTFVVSRGGVSARLAIEPETPGRDKVVKALKRASSSLAREFQEKDLRCYDDNDGRSIPAPEAAGKAPFWKDVAQRLDAHGSLDVGVGWPEARAVLLSYEDLLPAWRTLVPLFRTLGPEKK